MRFLCGSLIYDFTVALSNDQPAHCSSDEFLINFRFRRSNASEIETDIRRSIQISRTSQQLAPIMSDLLGNYEVPAQPKSDMSAHFKFNLERLNRIHRCGVTVAVNLEVKSITSERAEVIQRRRESESNRGGVVVRRMVDETAATTPASKAAVAALERGRLTDEGEERECAICLERFKEGVEVIKMPCLHIYHNDCIIRWLQKNHFCPFCRFKLPC